MTADGRMIVGASGETRAVDLSTGARAPLPGAGHLSTGVHGGFDPQGRPIALREAPDRAEGVWAWEIVRVDLSALSMSP